MKDREVSKNDLLRKVLGRKKRSSSGSLPPSSTDRPKKISRMPRGRDIPLSWAQQRLWFLEQLEDLGATYHMPATMRLRGMVDREALQRSLNAILARHEVLRTVFVQ